MNEKEKPYITEDVRRLSDICYMIGYLSAHVDKDWADGYSADIVEYIKDLFLAKRSNHITINPCPTYLTETDPTKINAEWTDADTLVTRARTEKAR